MSGLVVIHSQGALPHQGITLVMEGSVNLQLSSKSVGLFEAFYNSIKVLFLISIEFVNLRALMSTGRYISVFLLSSV